MLRRLGWGMLLCGLAPAGALADFDARPLVTAYSAEAVGQDAVSWRMVEDAHHGLFFGTNTLLGFDGGEWRSVPAGRAYAIRGLDAASDGRIWAAGTGDLGWFDRSASGRRTFHSLLPALASADRDVGEMWSAFSWGSGAVFAGAHALYWWDGQRFTVQRFAGERRMLLLRDGNQFYVSQAELGLAEVTFSSSKVVIAPQVLDGATVQWLERTGPDGWLIGDRRGLLRLAAGQAHALDPVSSAIIEQTGLTAVLRLADHRLAVATLRGGILLMSAEGRLEERLNRASGLPTDEIFSLGADHEAGLWATSSSHILRISLQRLRWYRDPAGDQPVAAMVSTPAGLALATDTGVFRADASGEHLRAQPEVARHCWALVAAGADLLLGSSLGLDRLRPDGTLESLLSGPGDVAAIAVAPGAESAVVAVDRKLRRVSLRGGGQVSTVATLPEAATALALGSDEAVWVGTMTQGVLQGRLAAAGQAPTALHPAELPGNSGPSLVVGRPGTAVYAFVDRAGWLLSGQGGGVPISGFPMRGVEAAEAEAGGAWVVHSSADGLGPCVAWIGLRDGRPTWEPRLIEGLWRVGIPESIHAEPTAGGTRLWVGGTAGILRCDLAATQAPPVILRTSLAVTSDRGVVLPVSARLPYSAGGLTVSVALDSYALRPALRGETRIDPIETEWSPLAADNRRTLPALRDGRYVVRARIRATTGQTGAEVQQTLIIMPPWWRRWFTTLGAVAALLGAGYGWHRWRSQTLRARARALEEAVRGRTREVEQANAEKTRFVAGISHDIRNPLNGIVGLTLALESSALDPRQRELTTAMRGCAKYLDGLVEEVIDFAQIEAGRGALRREWFDPLEVLDEVIAITRAEAELNGAVLQTECVQPLPVRVLGDAGRIRQILVNLAFNAIRHAGGEIVLRLAAIRGADAAELEFTVADTGSGIALEDQARLFEPFSRLEAPGKVRAPGTGLGLATSKRWSEIMGGALTVTSQVGAGAQFCLRVPYAPGETPVERETLAPVWRRVLLVEDEDYNAWAAEAVTARLGLRIAARAKTVQEALAAASAGGFDLVLLDRLLPDGDGTTVCRALRARGLAVKIVALTASATAEDRAACLAAGMDAFVSKPLTPEKLAAVLRGLSGGEQVSSADRSAGRGDETGRPINLRLLRYLSDGTPEGQARELRRYRSNLQDAVAALQTAALAEQPEAVRGCAHRLYGLLRMIEAEAACAAVAKVELSAQRGERPSAAEASEWVDALQRLDAELNSADGRPQNPAPARSAEAPPAI